MSPVSAVAAFFRGLSGARDDRKELFERLMKETSRQAFGVAYRLTGDSLEAEDLVQETFVRAYRFFHRYDETLPFTSWLYRIMTNVHIDSVRKRQRLRTTSLEQDGAEGSQTFEVPDESSSPDARILMTALDESLQMGLKSLNSEFRMAVILADVEGLSYEEVAEIMGTSVGTVRSRIHRGRKQLREYIEEKAPHLAPREGSC
jgi:RNA polymerase sigma-70 factor, ECF subfamily